MCCYFRSIFVPKIVQVITGTWGLALFIWKVLPVVCIASLAELGGLAATLVVIDISDITHSFQNGKSSSNSQLINGKPRNLQKLLKYFNGTSASNVLFLSSGVPIIFVLYSKDLLVIV